LGQRKSLPKISDSGTYQESIKNNINKLRELAKSPIPAQLPPAPITEDPGMSPKPRSKSKPTPTFHYNLSDKYPHELTTIFTKNCSIKKPGDWLQYPYPIKKMYEQGALPPLEQLSNDDDVDGWMTTFNKSQYVRQYFPNLDRQCLSYFLKFSAEFRKENYKFYEIAPLQYVRVLSPWNNLITEDQSCLDKLSNLVIESKDMDCSTFYFRKHWSLGTSQKQCQLVHFNPKKINNTGHDVYFEDLKALSEQFNKCASLDSKYRNWTETWRLGECFFLSLLKPDEDNMIAFIQFKRLDHWMILFFG
jgi:hypothetical protein